MFQIFKISKYDVIFLRNVRNGHFGRKPEKNTTTLVALTITTEIVIEKQQQIAGIAETVPSCNYCVATIVARPLRTTVKGGKPAFRKEDKSLISPDSRIRRGLGTETYIVLYKLLASLLCPDLNLINI